MVQFCRIYKQNILRRLLRLVAWAGPGAGAVRGARLVMARHEGQGPRDGGGHGQRQWRVARPLGHLHLLVIVLHLHIMFMIVLRRMYDPHLKHLKVR